MYDVIVHIDIDQCIDLDPAKRSAKQEPPSVPQPALGRETLHADVRLLEISALLHSHVEPC